MKCKVELCERDAVYVSQMVCQKHYFRMMRYGTYDLTRIGKAKKKIKTPNGYIKVYKPGHVLSAKNGYAFEHRFNLYESTNGAELSCQKCGAYWNWRPYVDHVDHIDRNRENNEKDNLRPLCNSCNVKRADKDYSSWSNRYGVTAFGETKTVTEWARDKRCSVSRCTIRRRIESGLDPESAIITPKNRKKK